jgi:hypothetical protein
MPLLPVCFSLLLFSPASSNLEHICRRSRGIAGASLEIGWMVAAARRKRKTAARPRRQRLGRESDRFLFFVVLRVGGRDIAAPL